MSGKPRLYLLFSAALLLGVSVSLFPVAAGAGEANLQERLDRLEKTLDRVEANDKKIEEKHDEVLEELKNLKVWSRHTGRRRKS